jgi:hypothetical protein
VEISGVGNAFCAGTEQPKQTNNAATEAEMKCRDSNLRIEFLRIG